MKKTLVEAANLDAFICQEHNTLYADGSILLTPGARDALSKRGVTIVHGPNPHAAPAHPAHPEVAEAPDASCSQGEERLLLAVAAMLQEQCGIQDANTLHAMSSCIVHTIRDNI